MQNKEGAAMLAEAEIHVLVEDEAELTPKELAQERKAAIEEQKRKAWLEHTPAQLAGRIPVSVFDLGRHVADA
ncbi:MAG TPA: hypothetical protein VFM98_16275 [Ramlibacter sp.]|uniref:hypothetical protein n=1 Tax=Ramlibacter sp. TaxID=1917967 RepID=UPI002D803806|nr:hypothetical protein [Ramlibacter sp.]HET8747156.1 hypothetical protein [Ramlibacter sp.]